MSATKISTGGVKKGRNQGEKVITANSLQLGLVVYLAQDGSWTEDLSSAAIFEGEAAMAALATAQAQETLVVGPYLMDVETDTDVTPDGRGRLREEIRKKGPTTRTDHGRQAWGMSEEIR